MKTEEFFSAFIAEAVLKSSGEDVQVEVLSDLVQKSITTESDLEIQLIEAMESSKKPGDFGMEIIGSLVIPVLIEAGKELWKLYFKKVSEKTVGKLADMTVDKAKKIAHSIWTGEETLISVNDYEIKVRKAAMEQNLTSEQTDYLVAALKKENMKDLLKNEVA